VGYGYSKVTTGRPPHRNPIRGVGFAHRVGHCRTAERFAPVVRATHETCEIPRPYLSFTTVPFLPCSAVDEMREVAWAH
jgi:hypothetical protein